MMKVLVLLPCLLMAARVMGSCVDLIQCENTISEEHLVAGLEVAALVSHQEELNVICSGLNNLTTCINTHASSCDNSEMVQEADVVKQVVEYICTSDGRQLVLRLADSECADNPLLEVQLNTVMEGCLETFMFDLQMEALDAAFSGREFQESDACPFVYQLEHCLVGGATSLCGPDMGEFISAIWNIATEEKLAEFGCSAGMARKRRFIKRAIPMILKRANLVKKYRK